MQCASSAKSAVNFERTAQRVKHCRKDICWRKNYILGESGPRDMPQNQGELFAILHGEGLFKHETPRSGLQYFNNSAFESAITELKSKPTRSLLSRASAAMLCSRTTSSAITIGQFSARPYTTKKQSETHRIIIGQKYLFVMREQIHAHHIPFHWSCDGFFDSWLFIAMLSCTRCRPARRFKFLD